MPEVVVEGMTWDAYLRWMRTHWAQGEHIATIGPTGEGKSTATTRLIAATRRYAVALDVKAGDDTLLAAVGTGKWQVIQQWPPPRAIQRQIEDHRPTRLIVSPRARKLSEASSIVEVHRRVVDDAYEAGSWTLLVDEAKALTGRARGDANMEQELASLLILARGRKLSVVSSMQGPRRVMTEAFTQCRHFLIFAAGDDVVIQRVAEIISRNWHDLKAVMAGLDPYWCIAATRRPRDPLRLIHAPPYPS